MSHMFELFSMIMVKNAQSSLYLCNPQRLMYFCEAPASAPWLWN